MLVFGWVPHSGPSIGAPTTGTPSCCAIRYAVLVKSETNIRLKTLFSWISSSTAVPAPCTLEVSSAVTSLSWCPLTPPSAFCMSMRAVAPCTAP